MTRRASTHDGTVQHQPHEAAVSRRAVHQDPADAHPLPHPIERMIKALVDAVPRAELGRQPLPRAVQKPSYKSFYGSLSHFKTVLYGNRLIYDINRVPYLLVY
jgi:hypothetical protein